MKQIVYLVVGIVFGIIMYKSEAASWFRIYEMFRFEAFHMYGIIGTALAFGVVFIWAIKRFSVTSFSGKPIDIQPKEKGVSRYLIGGILFGLGWALVGSCPGPIFVLLGAGFLPIVIVLLSAIAGTFVYGLLRDKLPH
ncbi:MAG: YeeE/YedE family protein [Algicola sp.]|nr:YeeE/YedE family protein [Algicola sp.]